MRRILIACAMLSLLLTLALVVLAQSSGGSDLPVWRSVSHGTASGGGYHLTSLTWQVSGTASGGEYRLLSPAVPALRGSGCCCTYLPLSVRNAP
jgi:hypothetical protein